MFNTTTATKMYVPVQDRAKLDAYEATSPRASRFGGSIRQFVYHSGCPSLGSIPASLVVDVSGISKLTDKSTNLEDICSES